MPNVSLFVFLLRPHVLYLFLDVEVHLRSTCHCMNLRLHNVVTLCPNLES